MNDLLDKEIARLKQDMVLRYGFAPEHPVMVWEANAAIANAIDKASSELAEFVIKQEREKLDTPAVRSTLQFVEDSVAPRKCDSDGVSDCVRCNFVFLSRTVAAILAMTDLHE